MKQKYIFISLTIYLFITTNTIIATTETFTPPDDRKYKKEWAKVDSLEKKGLPKSALKIVEKIYAMAKADNNNDQLIKSIVFRIKFRNELGENAFQNLIKDVENEIKTSVFPAKNMLHSMLADMYVMFYRANRYEIYEYNNTVDFEDDDINTWTIDKLINTIIKQYMLSLSNKEKLQSVDRGVFFEMIEKGHDSKEFRSSLYDFLAHKALIFFRITELSLSKPSDYFQLKENFYFSDAKSFSELLIKTKDTLSLHFYSILIYQDLLSFRLKDKNIAALINADLERLAFVYDNSVNPDKDNLYISYLNKLAKKYLNQPIFAEINYNIANYYYKRSNNYKRFNRINKNHKWDKKTALEICENMIEKFPKSYGAKQCKNLKYRILNASLNFKTEQYIPSGEKYTILVNYKNIDTIFIKTAWIDPAQHKGKYSGKKLYNKVLSLVKNQKNTIKILPGTGDYNNHTTEIIMSPLTYGTYVIMVSNNEKFSYNKNTVSFDFINVTDISYIQRKIQDGSYEFHTLNRKTGSPMHGVTVKSWYEKYNYKTGKNKRINDKTYLTNSEGYFKVQSQKKTNSRNLYFEFLKEKDYINTGYSHYLYYTNYHKASYTKIHLFTDRAIYRPGQTVYFKGIALKKHQDKPEIQAQYQTTVTLFDVNHQKVTQQSLTTNDYGSFNGTFTIPKGLLNGQMQIYTPYGNKYITVEEYKRPKFEINILPFEGNYVLNDTVRIKGKANAFAGSTITDAEVKYRVTRKPVWRGWWYNSIPVKEVQMTEGELITDDNGDFEIKFVALPDLYFGKDNNILFNYQVEIDVTDINGETQSAFRNMSVGYTSLNVKLDISENVSKKDALETNISTTNMNGEFVPAEGKITFYKLKSLEQPLRERKWELPDEFIYSKNEWMKKFPGNVYADENNIYKREIEKKMFSVNFNTKDSKKLDISRLKNWKSGIYLAETKSKDAFGNLVEWKNYFTLYGEKDKTMPKKVIDWFSPIKTKAEPGQNAVFLIGSEEKKVSVIYEIEHKGKILKKQWLTLNQNQQLIEIPVKEEYRGNFSVHFTFIKNNRLYKHSTTVTVPYTNKKLDITFETFRNKVYPGQKEEWKLKIAGKNRDKMAAEMLATLYDASLDKFKPNSWSFNIYNKYYSRLNWNSNAFAIARAMNISQGFYKSSPMPYRRFDNFNWFGFNYYTNRYFEFDFEDGEFEEEMVDKVIMVEDVENPDGPQMTTTISRESKRNGGNDDDNGDDILFNVITEQSGGYLHGTKTKKPDFKDVQIRQNFNETAFFYPNLQTDTSSNVIVKFTIPESLTKWRMMGFAHTKDLKYGFVGNELITQKDLMVLPNEPRFFRQSDQIIFPVKVSNISKEKLEGTARLELFDAISMKPVQAIFTKNENADKPFTVEAGKNVLVNWKLNIPDDVNTITYKVMAKAGKFSDGEQKALPVLSNRMLITETLPLPIRGKQTKDYELKKLVKSKKSKTIQNFKLTLEFTSNPAWYAIQALPYIMEYPYECSEQIFTRFYSNSIATHIVNSSPKIKRVFDSWKNTKDSKSFLSNLEKNQELKSILLEETPWVLDASDEKERKKRIGLLFDLNKMSNELKRAFTKLEKAQTPNGGWPWFKGMPESRYITQHIVSGFGHLDKLNVKTVRSDKKTWQMLQKAIRYIDRKIVEDFNRLKMNLTKEELQKDHLSHTAIHYLYTRSFFTDVEIPNKTKETFDYYKGQMQKYWLSRGLYSKGMIALAANRYDMNFATDITASLAEFAIQHEEMGMYWKENVAGYYWYQAPVETQALMIEVFNEVAKDTKSVDALKVWLLKQKQTQDWKTTKATTEAVYALLLTGTDWLESDKIIKIKLGNQLIDPKKIEGAQIEAGTGYFKTSWLKDEIKPEMGKVNLQKEDEGVAWGGLYWQYFEDLDKITKHKTPLTLDKKLFLEQPSAGGPIIKPITKKTKLKPGDKVIVRIVLEVDRRMEYVHMKDLRASGFEPINVFSRYKYQGGLGYYESTKDAATNFFMSNLPKGTYVFEYPLRVTHKGNFSNGITSIQCMYAPEFTSHSEGVRVRVE
ncbi:MAG: alpha-2-macroglobulin family protein [Bacteroidota bacterium]